jgi:hypothetical protein
MTPPDIQENFFRQIKQNLPTHLSLVDEVATLLNISHDSAYRRIRGEKSLALDELQLLATHYSISLDNFMNIRSENIPFSGYLIDRETHSLENYLQNMVNQLTIIDEATHKQLFYMSKDMPLFHNFMFPELACFKFYWWSRYNLNYSRSNKGQFLIDDFIDVFNEFGKQIAELYLKIPCTEIWNEDCINQLLRQVDFYRKTKVFQSRNDVIIIYECLEKLVDHIEQQVELGYKFPYKKPSSHNSVKYNVFINEFLLGDNTVAAEINDRKFVFLNHSVINYIMTENKKFVDYVFETIHLLLKKSTLISEVGEKDRQLFFQNLHQKIAEKKKLV